MFHGNTLYKDTALYCPKQPLIWAIWRRPDVENGPSSPYYHFVVVVVIKIMRIFKRASNQHLYKITVIPHLHPYLNQSTMHTPLANRKHLSALLLTSLVSICLLSSCYSVRFVDKHGTGEPDPLNNTNDPFFKGLKVTTLDTTISLKPHLGNPLLLESCHARGFYAFQYRVTFGGVLLSAITFGRKRQVRIKYVCMKEQ